MTIDQTAANANSHGPNMNLRSNDIETLGVQEGTMKRKSFKSDTMIRWCDVNAEGKNLFHVVDETLQLSDMILFGPALWRDCVSWRRANTLSRDTATEYTAMERAVMWRSEERGMAVNKIAFHMGTTPKRVVAALNRALQKKARRAEMRIECAA